MTKRNGPSDLNLICMMQCSPKVKQDIKGLGVKKGKGMQPDQKAMLS